MGKKVRSGGEEKKRMDEEKVEAVKQQEREKIRMVRKGRRTGKL